MELTSARDLTSAAVLSFARPLENEVLCALQPGNDLVWKVSRPEELARRAAKNHSNTVYHPWGCSRGGLCGSKNLTAAPAISCR
jgi:hypothetical protein